MLHRKIYQLCQDGREVCVFLRDQQRWIESGRIVDFEGDIVTIRYESIGAVTKKLASVSKINTEILVSDDCPEAEQIYPKSSEHNQE